LHGCAGCRTDGHPATAGLDVGKPFERAFGFRDFRREIRDRYCVLCGTPTVSGSAGHVMTCTNPNCATDHFPRLDPAIIVLVTDGERALLGRQASWPEGRYSTIAGFVEPGVSRRGLRRHQLRHVGGGIGAGQALDPAGS